MASSVAQPKMMIEDLRTPVQRPRPAVPDVSWEPPSTPSGPAPSTSGGPMCPVVPKVETMVHRTPESERQGPIYGLERILGLSSASGSSGTAEHAKSNPLSPPAPPMGPAAASAPSTAPTAAEVCGALPGPMAFHVGGLTVAPAPARAATATPLSSATLDASVGRDKIEGSPCRRCEAGSQGRRGNRSVRVRPR